MKPSQARASAVALRGAHWLLLLCLAGASGLAAPAQAQDKARVFLRLEADEGALLADSAVYFRARVLEQGALELAGSTEMDAVYAECRAAVGVSATEERACRLQAARRIFVEHVIELRARVSGAETVFTLSVWNPETNGLVFETLARAHGGLEQAAPGALTELADAYLCFRGETSRCSAPARSAEPTPPPEVPSQPPVETLPSPNADQEPVRERFGDVEVAWHHVVRGFRGAMLPVPTLAQPADTTDLGGWLAPGFELHLAMSDAMPFNEESARVLTDQMKRTAAESGLEGFAFVTSGFEVEVIDGHDAYRFAATFDRGGEPWRIDGVFMDADEATVTVSCRAQQGTGHALRAVCPRIAASLRTVRLYEAREEGFTIGMPGHWYNDPDTDGELGRYGRQDDLWLQDEAVVYVYDRYASLAEAAAALRLDVEQDSRGTWVTDGLVPATVAGLPGLAGRRQEPGNYGTVEAVHLVVPGPQDTLRVTCRFEAQRAGYGEALCAQIANSVQFDGGEAGGAVTSGRLGCATCSARKAPRHVPIGVVLFTATAGIGLARRRRPR